MFSGTVLHVEADLCVKMTYRISSLNSPEKSAPLGGIGAPVRRNEHLIFYFIFLNVQDISLACVVAIGLNAHMVGVFVTNFTTSVVLTNKEELAPTCKYFFPVLHFLLL